MERRGVERRGEERRGEEEREEEVLLRRARQNAKEEPEIPVRDCWLGWRWGWGGHGGEGAGRETEFIDALANAFII